jgi:hypothetical protein
MNLFRTLAPMRLAARPPPGAAAAAAASSSRRFVHQLFADAEGEEGEFAPAPELAFVPTEPTYMTTLTFSEAGVQAMLRAEPSKDKEKVRSQLTESPCTRRYSRREKQEHKSF